MRGAVAALHRTAAPAVAARRGARTLRRDRSATAAIEFAILGPVFFLLLFGIIEFGRALWMQSTLQQAVEAAARCATINQSQCGTTAAVQSYAASQAYGLTIASTDFTVATAACGEKVSINLPFNFVVPNLLPWTITLSAQSCYPT